MIGFESWRSEILTALSTKTNVFRHVVLSTLIYHAHRNTSECASLSYSDMDGYIVIRNFLYYIFNVRWGSHTEDLAECAGLSPEGMPTESKEGPSRTF
jgi:hypothetical protein